MTAERFRISLGWLIGLGIVFFTFQNSVDAKSFVGFRASTSVAKESMSAVPSGIIKRKHFFLIGFEQSPRLFLFPVQPQANELVNFINDHQKKRKAIKVTYDNSGSRLLSISE